MPFRIAAVNTVIVGARPPTVEADVSRRGGRVLGLVLELGFMVTRESVSTVGSGVQCLVIEGLAWLRGRV